MPDVTATPASPVTPKQTAANIVRGIQDKASGKAPTAPTTPPIKDASQQPSADPSAPNAGKERYVVEGKEFWLNAEQAKAYIQKGIAFEPRMDQLARLAQEQQSLMQSLLTNPGAVLANVAKQHNVPMQELVGRVLHGNVSDEIKEAVGKWYYENAVEPLKLTPEQLKARENAKWRQERENKDKETADAAVRAENHQRFLGAMGHLRAQIAEAMKDSELPDNNTALGAEMAWMVAKVMQLADKRHETMTPKQAIELVKQHRIRAVQSAYYETMADKDEDGEQLAKELGDKIVGKIKKYLLKQAKTASTSGSGPTIVPNGKPAVRGERKGVITPDEMHDYLAELKKKG